MFKRVFCAMLAMVLAASLAVPSLAQEEVQGLEVMAQLATEGYDALFERSNEPMRQALKSAEGFKAVWQGLLLQYGKYEGAGSKGSEEVQGYQLYYVEARFERAILTFGISFDLNKALAGLRILDVQLVESMEEDVGQRLLLRPGAHDETEAVLVLPQGDGPFPVVILVHGSGPNDKNESAFGMAPFRDLANGLAKRGIATLRYDKYTLAHSELLMNDSVMLASFTMNEEYVNDAAAAWELLSGNVRFSGIFLLGHSQGAYAVPRVAAGLPKGAFKGLILLAGSPLSITALIDRQSRDHLAQANLDPEQFAQAEEQLDVEKEKLIRLDDMGEEELKGTAFYGNLSGWYLADERAWAPVPLLTGMDTPLLIVQGGKDWQVKPEEGIHLWQQMLNQPNEQAALPGGTAVSGQPFPRPNTDYLLYPDMTHLLFDLQGPSSGSAADYAEPHSVSESLLDGLAGWVKSR
jgi:dienelactone hydrolase